MKKKGLMLDICLIVVIVFSFCYAIFNAISEFNAATDDRLQPIQISPADWSAFDAQIEKVNFAIDMHFGFVDDTNSINTLEDFKVILRQRFQGENPDIPYMRIRFANSREEASEFPANALVAYPTEITLGIANGINYLILTETARATANLSYPINFPNDFTENWMQIHTLARSNKVALSEIIADAQVYKENANFRQISAFYKTLELLDYDQVLMNHIISERRWVNDMQGRAPGRFRKASPFEFADISMVLETYDIDTLFVVSRIMVYESKSFADALSFFHSPDFYRESKVPISSLLSFYDYLKAMLYPNRVPDNRWDLEGLYDIYRNDQNTDYFFQALTIGSFFFNSNYNALWFRIDGAPNISLANLINELNERGARQFIEIVEYSRTSNRRQSRSFSQLASDFDESVSFRDFKDALATKIYPLAVPDCRDCVNRFYRLYRDIQDPDALSDLWAIARFVHTETTAVFYFDRHLRIPLIPLFRLVTERGATEFIEFIDFIRDFEYSAYYTFYEILRQFDARNVMIFLEEQFYPFPVPIRASDTQNTRKFLEIIDAIEYPLSPSDIWSLGVVKNRVGSLMLYIDGVPPITIRELRRHIIERGAEDFLEVVDFARRSEPSTHRFFSQLVFSFDRRDN